MALDFDPDGDRLLTNCEDGQVRLWELPRLERDLRDMGIPCSYDIEFSVDTRLVWVGLPEHAAYEVATGKKLLSEPAEMRKAMIAVSPDGRALAIARHDPEVVRDPLLPAVVRFWSTETGKPLATTFTHPGAIAKLTFSPDGTELATGSHDGKVRFWKVTTGAAVGTELSQPGPVTNLTISPDGRMVLAGGGDKIARGWDRQSGKVLASVPEQSYAMALAIARGGMMVLVGGPDKSARLWDVATTTPIGLPLKQTSSFTVAAFSPDGQMALTGSLGSGVQLWEAATGQPVGPPCYCPGWVRAVAFAPDCRTVFIGTEKAIQSWKMPSVRSGPVDRMILSVQVLTGLELAAGGEIRTLDPQTWEARRSQLAVQGGTLLP
jgi:WD40 repeat protein